MTENKNINSQKEEPDLYKRSVKGGYWVFAIRFFTQALGFIKSIIVFNFLFNENLELIIIANLSMAILNTFSESGFQTALVQKKGDVTDYLDTAWVTGIVRGILLFAVIYFAAPLCASFSIPEEKMPLAISVIRVMGVCFLIRAFQNIGIIYFQKELQFHKTFRLTITGTLTDIILSITLVLIYRSVWAYVIARVAASLVNLVMGYLLCSYRPRLHFVPAKAGELWKFGKWLFAGNVIGYLSEEGDDWCVLAFLGTGPLKLYRYAYQFSNMPATHITNTISQVSFPAYSKIQNDIPRLREAYLKVLQITAMISIPATALVFCLGPDFIRLFLIEESHAMIPALQILAFYGLLRSLAVTRGALFPAIGKPRANFRFCLMRIAILAVLIYPLTHYFGIIGTSIAVILPPIFINPLGLLLACRLLNCPVPKMLQQSVLPLTASILMGVILITIKYCLGGNVTFVWLFSLLILASILYVLLLWTLDSYCKYGFKQIILEQLRNILKIKKCLIR